jgi:hypothetical protein
LGEASSTLTTKRPSATNGSTGARAVILMVTVARYE